MKTISVLFLFAFTCGALPAETLEERVEYLEKKVAALEQRIQPLLKQQDLENNRRTLQQKARIRARKDSASYSREELREIEEIYVSMSKTQGEARKAIARTLHQKFPRANRTGCAFLYLAQMSEGEEQIALYKQAIKDYGDCFYFNGVQVGAFARFQLGQALKGAGRDVEAEKYFTELKTDYPDSIGHDGKSLIDLMED